MSFSISNDFVEKQREEKVQFENRPRRERRQQIVGCLPWPVEHFVGDGFRWLDTQDINLVCEPTDSGLPSVARQPRWDG